MNIVEKIKQINRDVKTVTRPIRDVIAKFILDKKQRSAKKIDFGKAKTVLFLRDDNKIGDMVVSTILFREIKKKYPKIKIIVLSGKDSKEIIKYNPYVDEIVETTGKFLKDLIVYFKLRKYCIDIIVDTLSFTPRPLYLLKLRIINPYFLIGYDKQRYNVYDHSIKSDKYSHITKKYGMLLNYFDINEYSLDYDIFFGGMTYKNISWDYENSSGKILINPFGASTHRTLSPAKLQELVDKIKAGMKLCNIFILCQNHNYDHVKNIAGAKILKVATPLETAYIISKSDCVVTPDTSVVHISRVFDKKMVVMSLDYSNNDEKVNQIWAPLYDKAVQVFVDTKNDTIGNDIENINIDFVADSVLKINS